MGKRYDAIDGLRTIGTIGILMMHIRGNNHYEIKGGWYEDIIPLFTNFVFLFMIISAFTMCCGYFEKLNEGTIRLEYFYKKRFARIWPYFALLVILDLITSPSKENLYESFADLTLAFGLLPNANISVIGVGWFLGVVFLFYMMFPFFVFLIGNQKRAWFSFLTSLFFHYICGVYFFNEGHVISSFSERTNIVYCAPYFFVGGLIYLYRSQLEKWAEIYRWTIFCIMTILMIVYCKTKDSIVIMLPTFSFMLIYSLGRKRKILCNRVTHFIGDLSLEIYLSHMVMFRIIEKIGFNVLLGNGVAQYILTVVLDICMTIIFSIFIKFIFEITCKKLLRK